MTTCIERRQFATLLGAAAVAWPLGSHAEQQSKRPLIAYLAGVTQTVSAPYFDSFVRGMHDFGRVEGRDFDMVQRYADGLPDRVPVQAQEVIELKPDIIFAAALTNAVAASKLTATIPIVCPTLADAVHLGLIGSDAHPRAN